MTSEGAEREFEAKAILDFDGTGWLAGRRGAKVELEGGLAPELEATIGGLLD